MTYTARPETSARISDTAQHWIYGVLAALGIVAAAFGALIGYGPADGLVNVFGWTWNLADVAAVWAPILMIGGGIVTTISMGIETYRDWEAEHSGWLVGSEAIVMLVGVAAIVVGIVLTFSTDFDLNLF